IELVLRLPGNDHEVALVIPVKNTVIKERIRRKKSILRNTDLLQKGLGYFCRRHHISAMPIVQAIKHGYVTPRNGFIKLIPDVGMFHKRKLILFKVIYSGEQ